MATAFRRPADDRCRVVGPGGRIQASRFRQTATRREFGHGDDRRGSYPCAGVAQHA